MESFDNTFCIFWAEIEISNVLDGGFIRPIIRYIQRIISQTVSLPRAEINYPASQEDCKLSAQCCCWQNSQAEKEISSWILVGDHSVKKDNKRFLGCAHTII